MPSTKLQKFGYPTTAEVGDGNRAVKLLKPICTPEAVATKGFDPSEACQLPQNARNRWWDTCSHEPYITRVKITRDIPQLSDPDERGEQTIEGTTKKVSYKMQPNIVQAHQMPNITSGVEAQVFMDQGCALPQDHGIAPFCEYQECYAQETRDGKALKRLIVNTKDGQVDAGVYCSPRQAQLVKARILGMFLEVYNIEVMQKQLSELAV